MINVGTFVFILNSTHINSPVQSIYAMLRMALLFLAPRISSRSIHTRGSVPRRHRIVVLGCGWAGFRFLKAVDRVRYDVMCVSPRNHFIFTPLLASSCVGTLEFRVVQEPVRTVPNISYIQATCTSIDLDMQVITCKEVYDQASEGLLAEPLAIPYDSLIIAVGAKPATFNIPGVSQYACFLKDLGDARKIRSRIIECFEHASSPGCDDKKRIELLTFVVVGGGPTGVEFAGEVKDFINNDVVRWFPDLCKVAHVELVEAGSNVLSAFDQSLSAYVASMYRQGNVKLRANTVVEEVLPSAVKLRNRIDGTSEVLKCGIVVWSTGLEPCELTKSLEGSGLQVDPKTGRFVIDDYLSLSGGKGRVYALGDCAVIPTSPLPPTAQVAQQQGRYLALQFNATIVDGATHTSKQFIYRHMGKLAYLGSSLAVADMGKVQGKGIGAFLFWRSSYLTM